MLCKHLQSGLSGLFMWMLKSPTKNNLSLCSANLSRTSRNSVSKQGTECDGGWYTMHNRKLSSPDVILHAKYSKDVGVEIDSFLTLNSFFRIIVLIFHLKYYANLRPFSICTKMIHTTISKSKMKLAKLARAKFKKKSSIREENNRHWL